MSGTIGADLRTLVDRYAELVDRGDGAGVAELFVHDGRMIIHLARTPETITYSGRAAIAEVISAIRYDRTEHRIIDHISARDGERATGVTSCEAHHLRTSGGCRTDRVVEVRYEDRFVRTDGSWRFEEREEFLLRDERLVLP